MLFRNDQRYELTKEDYQRMAALIGCSYKEKDGKPAFLEYPKGGVYIIPPKAKAFKNADGTETLSKPPFHIIPYEQNLETSHGTEKWNYTTRPPMIKPGETPNYAGDTEKLFTHRFPVLQNQPDLLFFLCCISKCGSHVDNASVVCYSIENKKREAEESINKRMQKVEVEAHILHPVNKLHPNDISRIAQAMKVVGVDDLTDAEIRSELLMKIEAMEASVQKNGYKTFMEFVDTTSPVGSRTDLLAGIQRLKDLGIIKWFGQSNKWGTVDSDGKKTGTICPLSPGRDKDESLEHHVITNPEIGEMVAKLIKDSAGMAIPG